MARLFWDRGQFQGRGQAAFRPDDYRDLVDRLSTLTAVPLQFYEESAGDRPTGRYVPVRMGNSRTGWGVVPDGHSQEAARVASVAAEVVGRVFTAEQDISSLAAEVADRYEELNFLYAMGARVGALLDENAICEFVVGEAAWLMNCDRSSIMVADEETGELTIRASVGLPENIPSDTSVRPGEGISGKVFESGHGIIVNEGDPLPSDSLQVSELSEANCFLSVPLKIAAQQEGNERVVGVFNLTRKRESTMFTASDLQLVSAVAATAATQIHNCRLINAERRRQELEHELRLAARIQLSLLPEEPLKLGMLQAAGYCKPARHVGGDLFDYWQVDDHLCLVVADVSGHDLGAALMATAFRSVVRSESAHRHSVAGLLDQVNRALFEDLLHSELLISAFYAEIDLATGVMTYCRAAHPKPVLLQLGVKGWLDTEGLLLGLRQDGEYEEKALQLARGDTVVFYTDGLLDAQDADKRDFGLEGVRRAALGAAGSPPQEASMGIVQAVTDHCGSSPPVDDLTVLVVRYGGPAGE